MAMGMRVDDDDEKTAPERLIMPFGQHRGLDIEDVPDDYLYYISCQDWITKWPTVHAYIKKNINGIKKRAGVDTLREELD
jgi:hypothetical protein